MDAARNVQLLIVHSTKYIMLCISTGSDSSESDGPPVSILAQEARKKKKKKLKSRRERNKHKALLKLTHSTVKAPAVMPTVQPSHQEPIMVQ